MKKILDAHPSVTIAYCNNGKLLMSVYDAGYPQVSYRFSANNIGGNPSKKDVSPAATLIREVSEEFSPEHKEKTNFNETVLWAEKSDIELIRKSLIKSVLYQDFLVNVKQLPNDTTTKSGYAIFSAFEVEIPIEVMEIAESNIRRCRRLCTEGLTGVFTLDELANDPIKGNLSTAHATAPILNDFFNSKIPYPSEIKASPRGNVRDFYDDYLNEFEYSDKAWKN
jgi:hypothetical protein